MPSIASVRVRRSLIPELSAFLIRSGRLIEVRISPVFGLIGLILGLVGWGNRGSENGPVILDNKGRLPTTDELYRQYHGLEIESEISIPDPFADTGQLDVIESESSEESLDEDSEPDWKGWDEG